MCASVIVWFSEYLRSGNEIQRANKKKEVREIKGDRRRPGETLKSRHRPEEGMSSSPCPLLAEEWNYPSLCAHTSFLLQMTNFPLWN